MLTDLIGGTPPPPPPDIKPGTRVYTHWQGDDDELCCGICWAKTPPHLGIDGRWYVWLDGNRLARCEDVRPLTPKELRQAHASQGKSARLHASADAYWQDYLQHFGK